MSQGGSFCAAGRGNVGKGAVDNLIDGVDRFFLTGPATKNENLGDEVILHIVGIVGEM